MPIIRNYNVGLWIYNRFPYRAAYTVEFIYNHIRSNTTNYHQYKYSKEVSSILNLYYSLKSIKEECRNGNIKILHNDHFLTKLFKHRDQMLYAECYEVQPQIQFINNALSNFDTCQIDGWNAFGKDYLYLRRMTRGKVINDI